MNSKPHKCVEVIDLAAEKETDYEVIDFTAKDIDDALILD